MTAGPGRGQHLQVFNKFKHQDRRGTVEEVKRRWKYKKKTVSRSFCLYLQSSLPRKARDILFLGSHPRKPLPLQSYEPTPAPGQGWDVTTQAFSSLLSSPFPLPVSLNWFSPGSKWPLCLLFLPSPCVPNEGQCGDAVCAQYIHHLHISKPCWVPMIRLETELQFPANIMKFAIAHDRSAIKKWPVRWPGCHRAG